MQCSKATWDTCSPSVHPSPGSLLPTGKTQVEFWPPDLSLGFRGHLGSEAVIGQSLSYFVSLSLLLSNKIKTNQSFVFCLFREEEVIALFLVHPVLTQMMGMQNWKCGQHPRLIPSTSVFEAAAMCQVPFQALGWREQSRPKTLA